LNIREILILVKENESVNTVMASEILIPKYPNGRLTREDL